MMMRMRAILPRLTIVDFVSVLGVLVVVLLLSSYAVPQEKAQGDWPMFGGTPSRNLVDPVAKNLPVEWSAEEGKQKNIKWSAAIGDRGYGAPVISGGRIFVSTNNKTPRDPKITGPKAVLMCFREKDGGFLWQAVYDMPPPEVDQQAVQDGLCSSPVVEGDRFYVVTPGCQVTCGRTDNGQTIWRYDMMKELKVYLCIMNSCAPLLVGENLYVLTGNGVDGEGQVKEPAAPSFIALDKKSGTLKWQSSLPGTNILYGQWGNASYAEIDGKGQVIFPGGDGWLYSLEPDSGKLLWKFECNPKSAKEKSEQRAKRNFLIATPVVHEGKVYVGIGNAPEAGFGNPVGHFWCVDAAKQGALVWHYGGLVEPPPKDGRNVALGPTISTCAVKDGLVYVAEEPGYLHCLDARTGQKYWEHDFKSGIWGSPLWADGKIYQGVEDGAIAVLAAGKEKKLLGQNDMGETVQSTPVVAHDVIYVLTKSKLYAIAGAK
jgi:outer membrane protein assembly factor BamB